VIRVLPDSGLRTGIVLTSTIPPGRIGPVAKRVEELGFSQVWVAEDPYLNGGFASAGIALAATTSMPVGLGLVSAVVRHPVVTAMEVATIADAFPNRFIAGIGLGSPTHLRQIGLYPESPLKAVRDCFIRVRNLLDGKGESFGADEVRLSRKVENPPPLYIGAIGPKLLQFSGQASDGSLLAVVTPPAYVTWAREQVNHGAESRHLASPHPLVSFALFAIDRDGERARRLIRPDLALLLDWFGQFAAPGQSPAMDVLGVTEQLMDMVRRGGAPVVEREMPESWFREFVIAGDPEECAAQVRRFLNAGADYMMLAPVPSDELPTMIDLAGAELLPRLR
jgi:5,10-methylenetetrahydromethanopterin reductase